MEILKKYCAYNLWANKKVCEEFLAGINTEQLDREIVGSFPSIRKTCYHIWDAEFIWLNRMKGERMTTLPIRHDAMTYEQFRKKMIDNSNNFFEYISGKSDAYFTSVLMYKNSQGKEFQNTIQEIVHHTMNHSTFHRGQIITMLRQVGFTKLESTDYISYCRM